MPCTTSSATSSSSEPGLPLVCRRATCGHTTTSPITVGGSLASVGEPGPRPPWSGWRPPGATSSSMGNASTSVGPLPPRNRSWRSDIACSSTKITDICASSGTRSSSSTTRARRTQRRTSTSTSDCSSAPKTVLIAGALRQRGPGGSTLRRRTVLPARPRPGSKTRAERAKRAREAGARPEKRSRSGVVGRRAPRARSPDSPSSSALVAFVGVDDVLHDLVADDVARAELDEREARQALEDVADHEQPGAAATLDQVDLGDVAGDHDPRTEPEAGQEHLHLLGRGVLRLVEDDERVVERPAPHERERRDLDDAPVHEPGDDLGLEHVVQRVVQRTEVRIDLGEDVARQEPEPLPGLDGGTREDDAVDLLRLERLHRERDGEIALAGAGGPDAERHRVIADRVDVALLARRLGPHGLAAAQHLGGEHVRRPLVRLEHLDAAPDALTVEAVALLEQDHHLLEQAPDALGLPRFPGDRDLVAAHVDLDRERTLDEAEKLVALPEKADHQMVAWNEDLDLSRRRRGHVGAIVALRRVNPVERGQAPVDVRGRSTRRVRNHT